jgi:hypothetical protein
MYTVAGLAGMLLLTSCIKQLEKAFTGATVVEIDAAVLNSNATGVTYPIITRIPPAGIPLRTADSTLRRWSGTVKVRVNLVGPQVAQEQTIGYKIFTSPITSISFPATATGQTPTAAAGTLSVLNALAGTHFTALSGKCTIPANSSFGFIDLPVINAGTTAAQGRFVGIQLDSTGTLMPNPNYARIGMVIDQR